MQIRAFHQKYDGSLAPTGYQTRPHSVLLFLLQDLSRLPMVGFHRISQSLLPLSNGHCWVVTEGNGQCGQIRHVWIANSTSDWPVTLGD